MEHTFSFVSVAALYMASLRDDVHICICSTLAFVTIPTNNTIITIAVIIAILSAPA